MIDECLEWEVLNDFADGRLSVAEKGRTERHLASCVGCREALERLVGLGHAAAELDESIEPPAELWAAIRVTVVNHNRARSTSAQSLDRSAATVTAARRRRDGGWRLLVTNPRWLVAAGVGLVLLSSSITALILRGSRPIRELTVTSGATSITENGMPRAPGSARIPNGGIRRVTTSVDASEQGFRASLADLEVLFDRRRQELAPETVRVVERAVAAIDVAIAEMRAALLADPANAELSSMLNAGYRHKLELLRRATDLTESS